MILATIKNKKGNDSNSCYHITQLTSVPGMLCTMTSWHGNRFSITGLDSSSNAVIRCFMVSVLLPEQGCKIQSSCRWYKKPLLKRYHSKFHCYCMACSDKIIISTDDILTEQLQTFYHNPCLSHPLLYRLIYNILHPPLALLFQSSLPDVYKTDLFLFHLISPPELRISIGFVLPSPIAYPHI